MDKFTNVTCLAIHDISGVGKCSLTVALPILSAMGTETSVLPTAVLSTHTAFKNFICRDFTEDLLPFAQHWQREGAVFDCMYSGFLGSEKQISLVSKVFDMFRTRDNLIVVDPVMGDGGKLYSTYTKEMAMGVTELCKKADVIVPNMTEAAYITGTAYKEGPYEKKYVEEMLEKLLLTGAKHVVLTGIAFDNESLGAASISRETGEISYSLFKKYPGYFHGTGDIFASVLTGAILKGFSVPKAQSLACEFVGLAIERTISTGRDYNFGVCFEVCLPGLIKAVQENDFMPPTAISGN